VLRDVPSSSSVPDCDVLATCCKRITTSIEPKNEEYRVPGRVGRTQSFVVRGARVRRIWNDAVERPSERGGAEWPVEESSLFAADTLEIFSANPAFAKVQASVFASVPEET
jgi:hypothetical protein